MAIYKTIFGYISASYSLINMKSGGKKQNHIQTRVTWSTWQISRTHDGGWLPFWKWLHLNKC